MIPSLGTYLGFGFHNLGSMAHTHLPGPPRVQVSTTKRAGRGMPTGLSGPQAQPRAQTSQGGGGSARSLCPENSSCHTSEAAPRTQCRSHHVSLGGAVCAPPRPGGRRLCPAPRTPAPGAHRTVFCGDAAQHLAPRGSELQAARGPPCSRRSGGARHRQGTATGCARPPGGQSRESWRAGRAAAGVGAATGPGPTAAPAVR